MDQIKFEPYPDWQTMPFPGAAKEPSFPWRYLFAPIEGDLFTGQICKYHGCTNSPPKHAKYCNTCHGRMRAIRDPWRYYFRALKLSAKKRNIEFKLTFEEFRAFCDQTNYLQLVGRSPGSFHIDRVDNFKGYEVGNIQLMESSANVGKGNRERHQEPPTEEQSELWEDD
jgi:hypothetical protein